MEKQKEVVKAVELPKDVLAVDGEGNPTAYLGEFKGNKLITLTAYRRDRMGRSIPFDLSMGKSKAKLILAHIEDLKKFLSIVETA